MSLWLPLSHYYCRTLCRHRERPPQHGHLPQGHRTVTAVTGSFRAHSHVPGDSSRPEAASSGLGEWCTRLPVLRVSWPLGPSLPLLLTHGHLCRTGQAGLSSGPCATCSRLDVGHGSQQWCPKVRGSLLRAHQQARVACWGAGGPTLSTCSFPRNTSFMWGTDGQRSTRPVPKALTVISATVSDSWWHPLMMSLIHSGPVELIRKPVARPRHH